MNKSILLDGKNKDEQILLSKILDKVEESKKKNKITNTDFFPIFLPLQYDLHHY